MAEINQIDYDPADYLKTPQAVRDYLQAALDEGDVHYFIQALNDAARSHALAAYFENIENKTLLKTLSNDSHPPFETVYNVLSALNMHQRLSNTSKKLTKISGLPWQQS